MFILQTHRAAVAIEGNENRTHTWWYC